MGTSSASAVETAVSVMGLSTADISVLVSAVLGAFIAGAVSWLLARQTSNETLRRDAAARNEALGASALRLMIKVSLVFSDAQSLNRVLRDALENGAKNFPPNSRRWQYVPAISMDYQVFDVDADELRPLLAMKEPELFQSAVTTIMMHRDMVNTLRRYAQERERLKDLMPPELQQNERIFVSGLGPETQVRMGPTFANLDALIENVIGELPRLVDLSGKVTAGIGPAIRLKLGLNDFPVLGIKPN